MTVDEVYRQAQQLSPPERKELFTLLLDDITPEPPNSVRSREHLIELLEEGMKSPLSPMTTKDWDDIRQEVLRRSAHRKESPLANA